MEQPAPRPPAHRGDRKGTASLTTLAAHLGLSTATISRVLTQAPASRAIPHATQKRIIAAAEEFNYRPNLLARSLRRGQSMTIGVIVPELSEGYATLVLAGLEETLAEAGYAMMLITHHHRDTVLAHTHRTFMQRGVDGIIAVDSALPVIGDVPTVTLSCPTTHVGVTNILLNHDRAAELALHHLVGLGHRRIAIIKGQAFSSDTETRWCAIQGAADRLGVTIHNELIVQMEQNLATEQPGFLATESLLMRNVPFTALFAFNDVAAVGAIRALQLSGRRVPHDVSVVGFDDVSLARYHRPALTTVRQPLHYMGQLAAQMILRQMAPSAKTRITRLVVNPELVIRESTGPALFTA